jgi:DNA-binding MarR family transcriptional regulator
VSYALTLPDACTRMQLCKHQDWILGILMGVKAPASNPKILSQDQVKAWFALLFAHATVTRRMDAVLLEQHKLSFSAFEILCWLLETEPQSIRTLSGKLVSVSPTRASRLVQDLIDAGHLQRGADQGDGRVSLISFTESGRHFAETAKRSFEESVKKYFVDPLDDDDIAALTRIWAKLEHAGGQD